jgi:DNA polymerase III sliding clamp (beta) subunit (PCNA family)
MSQKKQELKAVVSRDDIEMVVRRASLAAMTEEGQSEINRASNETRGCIRVTAKKGEIVFDAGVSRFASRHVVKVTEGSMTAVEAEGESCVPAKEFKEVVSKIPSECGVGLYYKYQPSEPDPSTPEALKSLMPDGILSVGAIRKNRSVSKAHIESYPTEHVAAVEYPAVADLKVILSAPSKIIKEAYGAIQFTVNPKDANEQLNKVALYDAGDTVYFMGTDTRRCAIFPVKKASLAAETAFSDEENGRPIPVTLDAEYLAPILAATGDEEVVTIAADTEGKYLYLFCGPSSYRINRLARSLAAKYPDYRRMFSMTAGPVLLLDRVECQLNLDMMRPANNARGQYTFDKEGGIIRLSGKGLQAIKGADGELPYKQVGGDPVKSTFICLHTDYFREAVKQMKAENIRFSLSKDETKVRVEDETDPKFFYFMQVMRLNEAV